MRLEANGIRLNYEKSGAGPPVVLLHGNSSNMDFFGDVLPFLETHYTVYRLDSRCHGKSEITTEIGYDLMAEDTLAFIKAMGIQHPAILGSSDGAIVGLLLSIQHPGLLSCNIACGANTHPDKLKRWFYWMFRLASTKFGRPVPLFRMVVEQPDIKEMELATIATPTMIMAGSKDITLPGHQEEMAAAIPNAQLCILAGESHTSYFKKPKLLMEHCGPFLQKHTKASL